jgi:hypothetical protein
MVGNYFTPRKFPLTSEQERKIHKKVKFWEGDEHGELGNIAKLIRFARENDFTVKYFLEGPHGDPPDADGLLWKRYLKSFIKVLQEERGMRGVEVVERCDLDELLEEVIEGRPVVCEVKFSRFLTHALVIRGVKNNIVYVVDPLRGYYRLFRQELEDQIDLGYMKNALSLGFQKQA